MSRLADENPKAWRKAGVISHAHGILGELFLFVPSQDFDFLKKINIFSLKKSGLGGSHQIFDLRSFSLHKNGAILRSPQIKNRNQAEDLVKSDFFVSADLFISKANERIYLDELLGFQVYDRDQSLGSISGFSSNGPQDLLLVQGAEDEMEIPFVEAFIREIVFDQKIIKMELPEGLTEINLKPPIVKKK